MTKIVSWKAKLVLLGMSATVLSVGFPVLSPTACSQYLTNNDLVGFYQTTGGLAIDAAFDPARNIYGAGSDWNNIVLEPTVNTIQTVWNNWVWSQFPQDAVPNFD